MRRARLGYSSGRVRFVVISFTPSVSAAARHDPYTRAEHGDTIRSGPCKVPGCVPFVAGELSRLPAVICTEFASTLTDTRTKADMLTKTASPHFKRKLAEVQMFAACSAFVRL